MLGSMWGAEGRATRALVQELQDRRTERMADGSHLGSGGERHPIGELVVREVVWHDRTD